MTIMIMLVCDEPGCSKKIWIEKDHSKTRLYEKAMKYGWKIDDRKSGECRCLGHRMLRNGGGFYRSKKRGN